MLQNLIDHQIKLFQGLHFHLSLLFIRASPIIRLNPAKRLTTDEILKLIKQLRSNYNKNNNYIINELYNKEFTDIFNSSKMVSIKGLTYNFFSIYINLSHC